MSNAAKIRAAIARGARLPHQAVSIAMDLFFLIRAFGSKEPLVDDLVQSFFVSLSGWGMEDLLATQIDYARTLAAAPGELEYEEMHKLFSICDEIQAMREIGLSIEDSELEDLATVLRSRFLSEARKARLVAEDKAEEWNREWWWYRDSRGEK